MNIILKKIKAKKSIKLKYIKYKNPYLKKKIIAIPDIYLYICILHNNVFKFQKIKE